MAYLPSSKASLQPGYLVEVFFTIRVSTQENNPKKLLVVISLSRFMTTWAMGLKGGEGGGKRVSGEQHCKRNANLWNAGSLLLNPKANSRKVNRQGRNCRTHFNASSKLFINYLLSRLSPSGEVHLKN